MQAIKYFKLFDQLQLHKTSPHDLQEYLKSSKIKYERKQIGNSIHIRSQDKGFEVQYLVKAGRKQISQVEQYELGSVFIYVNNSKNKSYPSEYSLPCHVSHKLNILGAVMLLGEPTTKSKYLTQCIWENLGLDIVFAGGGWHDPSLIVDYICLFEASASTQNQCSICHAQRYAPLKSVRFGCQNCKVVAYCGETCRGKHQRLHEMYCQSIDEQ